MRRKFRFYSKDVAGPPALVIRAYLFSLPLVFFVLVQKRTKKEKARIQRSPDFWSSQRANCFELSND